MDSNENKEILVTESKDEKKVPTITSKLRHNILEIPKEVYKASGIVIYGRRIKSFVFSTDIAIIRNCDADAVFAVYPCTPPNRPFLMRLFPIAIFRSSAVSAAGRPMV